MNPTWLGWARRLQAIAQNGLTYAQNPFDAERYKQIRGIAAEMMATSSDRAFHDIRDLFAGEVGYATPKVDVRGAVFRDDTILLVKERLDGLWTLPGGWADVGDSPSEAVVREIREESGFHTRVIKLLALYDRDRQGHPPFPFHVYKVFFQCEITGGAPALSMETEAVDFFRQDELPALSVSRVMPAQIARLFEHYRHPEWPADFD